MKYLLTFTENGISKTIEREAELFFEIVDGKLVPTALGKKMMESVEWQEYEAAQ